MVLCFLLTILEDGSKIVKPKPFLFHRTLNFIVSYRTFLFPELTDDGPIVETGAGLPGFLWTRPHAPVWPGPLVHL